ncbi:MAG: T9SS type A sorting domain-containing protein [Luteibaculum sp.]
MVKRLFFLAFIAFNLLSQAQVPITIWNFNDEDLRADDGSFRNNTISLVGGATNTFASGMVDGGSNDPDSVNNRALNTSNYPEQLMAPRTAGIEIPVFFGLFEGASISFDLRASNTAANQLYFEVSADGGASWKNAGSYALDSATTWRKVNVDLRSFPELNRNDFLFRILTDFSAANEYSPANNQSSYGPNGTLRFDMIEVFADQMISVEEKQLAKPFQWTVNSEGNLRLKMLSEVDSIELVSITGAKIQIIENPSNAIYQMPLPHPGMYFLRVVKQGQMFVQKVIR